MIKFKFDLPEINLNQLLEKQQAPFGQNLFVIALTQGKQAGTFLEIGAYHPYQDNNTYLLEKEFGWHGISIDIKDFSLDQNMAEKRWNNFYSAIRDDSWPAVGCSFDDLSDAIKKECINAHEYNTFVKPYFQTWNELRPNTQFIKDDANNVDYSKFHKHFDFLQIDIDSIEPSLTVLKKLLKTNTFSVITFEHDLGNVNQDRTFLRSESRKLLKENGYELLINDVTIPPELSIDDPFFLHYFEDWYINPLTINKEVSKMYKWVDYSDKPKYPKDILFKHTDNMQDEVIQ